MITKSHPSLTPRVVLLFLGFLFSGCSVFSTVGDWITQGYDNTVSYFNAFYNAKRIFGEAETELTAIALSSRGKAQAGARPTDIPGSARQKFTLVIDKCSNVLSFYPKSSYVDDALFLIGKSYFYQGDFVKAERKFAELVAQYPSGPLALEGQLWFLKTLKKLERIDDALKAGATLIEEATRAQEGDIAGEAHKVLGEINEAQQDPRLAIERYESAVETSEDDFVRATVQARIGDLLTMQQEYDKAARAFLKGSEFSDDTYLVQYCRVQAAIAYRALRRFDSAFALLTTLLDDYRFNEYVGAIRYELGKTFAASGRMEDAVAEFTFVDTTYARSEVGTKAAFDLGQLLEFRAGDYRLASVAYGHASSNAMVPESREASRRTAAFSKYFEQQKRFQVTDSVLNALEADSLWSSQAPGPVGSADSVLAAHERSKRSAGLDSAGQSRDSMSLRAGADSLAVAIQSFTKKSPRPSRDSLISILSGISYELGELFYAELENPDSAFFWYNQSLSFHKDSTRVPRILFIQAEIIRAHPEKYYGDANELSRGLVQDHPTSPYAERAKITLGYSSAPKSVDPAESIYSRADSLITAGSFQRAVASLKSLAEKYPESPLAAKSKMAIAWLYEKHLAQPDSALAYYKRIVEKHATSQFAEAARRRIPIDQPAPAAPTGSEPASVDTTLKPPSTPAVTPMKKADLDPSEEKSAKAPKDTSQTRRAATKEQ